MDDDPTFDLVAASLRADTSDLAAYSEALAVKLEGALPGKVKVRRGGGFMGRANRVEEIVVQTPDAALRMRCDGGSLQTSRDVSSGGIVLKHQEIALDEWIDEVSRAATAMAAASEQARLALERMLEQ
jgi:hypothetical protein